MTPEQQAALQPVASELSGLGAMPDEVWDMAVRLAYAPVVAGDFMNYAEKRRTQGEAAAAAETTRVLPGGLTVGRLMREYALEPIGAFLMAAALVSHESEAMDQLEKMLAEGIWIRTPDGSHKHREVPAALSLPTCPACALRIARDFAFCPRCGWDLRKPVE